MVTSNGYRISHIVLNGFNAFFSEFQNITIAAQTRFEKAQWLEVQKQMRLRLRVYKQSLRHIKKTLISTVGDDIYTLRHWQLAKVEYATLTENEKNADIMQTYFNSAFCCFFDHHHIKNNYTFAEPKKVSIDTYTLSTQSRDLLVTNGLSHSIHCLLMSIGFNLPYFNSENDCRNIVTAIKKNINTIDDLDRQTAVYKIEYLPSLFFRNKGAYLAGRLYTNSTVKPFVVAFVNENQCVHVDAVLFSTDEISKIFSFTRSYFMVDTRYPSIYVAFLKTMLPKKEVFEIYTALGFAKHGKSLFYSQTVKQTKASSDEYIYAPGIKGMVMLVFTLPSLDYVYKLIKDRFTPPKSMTQQQVKDKYKLIKRHDRVGRMADTFEFRHLVFDIRKFSKELLDELYLLAPSKIKQKGNALIIEHIYVERKMTPLNLYLSSASDSQCESVMIEYGTSIKELAAANIFPGDMLLKNFGVTRHNRVIFYDYDEVCLLTECNFRNIPKPANEQQELSNEPWYTIADNDIFPEEFGLFFSGNQRAKTIFEQHYIDLYTKEFWQQQQQNILSGEVPNVYPYCESFRFNK